MGPVPEPPGRPPSVGVGGAALAPALVRPRGHNVRGGSAGACASLGAPGTPGRASEGAPKERELSLGCAFPSSGRGAPCRPLWHLPRLPRAPHSLASFAHFQANTCFANEESEAGSGRDTPTVRPAGWDAIPSCASFCPQAALRGEVVSGALPGPSLSSPPQDTACPSPTGACGPLCRPVPPGLPVQDPPAAPRAQHGPWGMDHGPAASGKLG